MRGAMTCGRHVAGVFDLYRLTPRSFPSTSLHRREGVHERVLQEPLPHQPLARHSQQEQRLFRPSDLLRPHHRGRPHRRRVRATGPRWFVASTCLVLRHGGWRSIDHASSTHTHSHFEAVAFTNTHPSSSFQHALKHMIFIIYKSQYSGLRKKYGDDARTSLTLQLLPEYKDPRGDLPDGKIFYQGRSAAGGNQASAVSDDTSCMSVWCVCLMRARAVGRAWHMGQPVPPPANLFPQCHTFPDVGGEEADQDEDLLLRAALHLEDNGCVSNKSLGCSPFCALLFSVVAFSLSVCLLV